MSLTELRKELLQQHVEIRRIALEARGTVEHCRHHNATIDDVRRDLERLHAAVAIHNAKEEALLKDVVPTIDAWGPVRAARMDGHHEKEHERMLVALREAAEAEDPMRATELVNLVLDEILEHMASEEKDVLSASVLRDDTDPGDYSFGG